MGFVLGYGTDKKWKGRECGFKGMYPDLELENLWNLNYNDVRDFVEIEGKLLPNIENYKSKYNQNSEAGWRRAFIFDSKDNINIFSAQKHNGNYSFKFAKLDKYSLKKAPPNYEKVKQLDDLFFDLYNKNPFNGKKIKA